MTRLASICIALTVSQLAHADSYGPDHLARLHGRTNFVVCHNDAKRGGRSDSPNVTSPSTCSGTDYKIESAGLERPTIVEVRLRHHEPSVLRVETHSRFIEFGSAQAASDFLAKLRSGGFERVTGVFESQGFVSRIVNPRSICRNNRTIFCTTASRLDFREARPDRKIALMRRRSLTGDGSQ